MVVRYTEHCAWVVWSHINVSSIVFQYYSHSFGHCWKHCMVVLYTEHCVWVVWSHINGSSIVFQYYSHSSFGTRNIWFETTDRKQRMCPPSPQCSTTIFERRPHAYLPRGLVESTRSATDQTYFWYFC